MGYTVFTLPCEQVVQNYRKEISRTFAMLDADGGGEVDAEEFVEGLQLLVNGNEVRPSEPRQMQASVMRTAFNAILRHTS